MNSRELILDLPLGHGDSRQHLLYARLLLSYLADHVYSAELANGAPLRDVTDFSQWCRELAEEAAKIGRLSSPATGPELSIGLEAGTGLKVMPPAPQTRWKTFACPDCFHVHEGREECGYYLGEERFCRCPSKVVA